MSVLYHTHPEYCSGLAMASMYLQFVEEPEGVQVTGVVETP